MILPTAEPASGEVSGHRLLCDDRIPIRVSHDRPARLLGYWNRPAQCPDGRHLWDAIVATAPDVPPDREDDDEDEELLRFRLVLTCVRCGRIERLEGVMHDDGRCGPRRVDPEPLRAGGLLAQQVGGDRYGGDLTSWAVHGRPDRAPIGCITWGRGLRSRHYFQGRFDAWPAGQAVEAATPTGCLRKLAKAGRACADGDVA
ncbi:MAG TPA: hypothetical protein VKB14_16245 [Actinomycetales bacterium]|nr:hypothetical protein [Actinomycetales bacterium]